MAMTKKLKIILLILGLNLVFAQGLFAEVPGTEAYEQETLKMILQEKISEKDSWGIEQGTWFLKRGEFYSEVYTKYYWHNQQFDSDGDRHRWDYSGKGRERDTEFKLEHGVTDKCTFMVYLNFKEAYWKDEFKSTSNSGPVYARPGLKYLLFKDPFLGYLQFKMKFPLGFDEQAVASLGTHQIDGEIKFITAQHWPKMPGYTKFEIGFRGRNEEPTNEIIYYAQVGYDINKNILLEVSLDGQEGLADTGGIDEDYAKFTIGPVFRLGLLNFKLGYGRTFAGKNTSAAEEIYSSLYGWW